MKKNTLPIHIPRNILILSHRENLSFIQNFEKEVNEMKLDKGEEKILSYEDISKKYNINRSSVASLLYPLTLSHQEIILKGNEN